jgi:hypothetical protein
MPRIALSVAGEDIADAETGQHVTGEGVPAEDHPGTPPDGDDGGGGRKAGRIRPDGARPEQPGRAGPVEGRAEPFQAAQGLLDGRRCGHPDPDAGAAQRCDVLGAVLLGIRDDEVGRHGENPLQVGPLGATDAGHVETGRMGAPVRGADEETGIGRGNRLGERGNQRDHPRRRPSDQRRPEVVQQSHQFRIFRPRPGARPERAKAGEDGVLFQTSVMRMPACAL